MIRFLFRFLGLVCLALGFIFLVYDGIRLIANGMVGATSIEKLWNEIFLKTPQDVLRPLIAPFGSSLWDPVVVPFLGAPVCLVFIVLGSIFILFGRKKRPLIGYARD
jgi:hypothetical protein